MDQDNNKLFINFISKESCWYSEGQCTFWNSNHMFLEQKGEVGNWPRNKLKQKKVLKKRLCLALLLLIFVALCIKYCFHRNNRTTCISNICLSKTEKKKKQKNLHMNLTAANNVPKWCQIFPTKPDF